MKLESMTRSKSIQDVNSNNVPISKPVRVEIIACLKSIKETQSGDRLELKG